MKKILFGFILLFSIQLNGQINQAKVYWVGHSLISHTDYYEPASENLINVMNTLATSQGKTYDFYQHTTPGSPLGWNWGSTPDSWAVMETVLEPLILPTDPDYGTFDVMVITEAINLYAYYQWWSCGFYARKFYNAAKNANPNVRLFMYESWHHYHASDEEVRAYYGPISLFDWKQYTLDVRPLWEDIIDEASDPAITVPDGGYSYQGSGTDPGNGNDTLQVFIIPTGQVLINVLDRLALNLPGDNWAFNGSTLEDIDFFMNPFSNFPTDTVTTVHAGTSVDDVHPSHVQIYLNSLVHYSVVYQEDPVNLPAVNGVPANIADIFKEVAWECVDNDPRTGLRTSQWTGLVSNDWTDPLNWLIQHSPNTSSRVIIPDNTPFQAQISVNTTIEELVLEANADIEVLNGAVFTVTN